MNHDFIAPSNTRIESRRTQRHHVEGAKIEAAMRSKQSKLLPTKLDAVILWGENNAPYTLADIIQMLEIDIMMGRRQDFHKRLLRTIESLVNANE